jgi:hypothetical protein|tara:strand:+ start:338 stop:493 length:156 start_codon:yes stop_codon:yes gene_type:complete
MSPLDITLIIAISLHWGFATGAMIAARTTLSIPRFILILWLFRYMVQSYGL